VIETRYQEALATVIWRKASYSQGQNGCVEVGSAPDVIGVRDSKLGPASPILAFGRTSWAAFTARVTASE
jgi:hypothetical protein